MKLLGVLTILAGIALLLAAIGCSVGAGEPDVQESVESNGKQEITVSPTSIQLAVTSHLDSITDVKVDTESLQTANVRDPKKCISSGGKTVESGWAGKGTGDNYCNDCFCSNGALGCTKMLCPVLPNREPNTSLPTDIPSAHKPPVVGGEDHTNRRVGHKVGDISPDFSILLTTGETLYSSNIRSDRMPVFLFFFSPT
ncbi:uncharacterized protein METZ01_LOCUS231710 [marine metagenome]|uniref:Pacifastin domain-containing protein n=1 Tax=marine metagenome TaxID=408172 RepID=A0A382GUS6_9ZZZZ